MEILTHWTTFWAAINQGSTINFSRTIFQLNEKKLHSSRYDCKIVAWFTIEKCSGSSHWFGCTIVCWLWRISSSQGGFLAPCATLPTFHFLGEQWVCSFPLQCPGPIGGPTASWPHQMLSAGPGLTFKTEPQGRTERCSVCTLPHIFSFATTRTNACCTIFLYSWQALWPEEAICIVIPDV